MHEEEIIAPDYARDVQSNESGDEESENDVVPSLQNQNAVLQNNFFMAQGIS